MKKFKSLFLILAVLFTLVFCAWGSVRIVKYVNFNLNCEAYLKRAAVAITVDTAKEELAKAIGYIEENELTTGVVSIFLKNPTNDIGFWYRNIKSAHEELTLLPGDATALEKTNVLMKLRESLTDKDSTGETKVVFPDGLEIHPNNVLYFWWCIISCTVMCLFWTLFVVSLGLKFEVTKTTIVRKKT